MKKVILQTLVLVWTSTLFAAPLGSSFTYQGRLDAGGNPANGLYEMQFTLFDALTNGNQVGLSVTVAPVTVTNGIFTAPLDFGPGAFDGGGRWLEISVNLYGSEMPPVMLSPRQPISATPYALFANSAGGLMSFADAPLDLKVGGRTALRLALGPDDGFLGYSLNIAGGSRQEISPFTRHSIIAAGDANRIEGGDYVTISGGSGITVQSNASFVVVSGGANHNIGPGADYSVIAGGEDNHIGFAAQYSSIGGGTFNRVEGSFGTIGGGSINVIDVNSEFNTIAGGYFSRIGTNASYSSIGGGYDNDVFDNARQATIAGGAGNRIGLNAAAGTIGGGENNFILENSLFNTIGGGVSGIISTNSHYGTIGGGYLNRITENAQYATVPGGRANEARDYGLAAGYNAKARHSGAFVWADATGPEFASTTSNQFNVRASGGVRFVTGGAGITVDNEPVLAGKVKSTQIADGVVRAVHLEDGAALAEILDDDGPLSGLNADLLDGLHASAFWQLGGNASTIPGTHFVGTTDNRPLDLRVNNQRALRLEPTASNDTVNVIGGSVRNFVAAGVIGATIGGGGASSIFLGLYTNSVAGDFGTIAGGLANRIHTAASFGAIAGGENNAIGTNSSWSAVVGGRDNVIGTNAEYSFVAGGLANNIAGDSKYGSISGGAANRIERGSWSAVIAGGSENIIATNSSQGTIPGGSQNEIGANSGASTVGGGVRNHIAPNCPESTIAGGIFNDIGTNSIGVTISGGHDNNVQGSSSFSTIAGGFANGIGTNAPHSAIGGGTNNIIAANCNASTIGGGFGNGIGTNSSACTVGGGTNNTIAANARFATIPGGQDNFATNNAFAAGTRAKAIHSGAFVWGDSTDADISSTNANSVTIRASGGYRLFSNTNLNAGVFLAPSNTSWSIISDRNAKKNFKPLDSEAVLEKLARVPVQRWNYRWESDDAVAHLGPMAQDFKAAFYPGRDDTSITTQEIDGVALAAIQGLNQKLQQELSRRDAENADLKRRLEALEKMLEQRRID
jgi:hypothetical protein